MLNLITPTGNRHKAFELCVKYMRNQTYSGVVNWFILDDGQARVDTPMMPKNWNVKMIRLAPKNENTQRRNLIELMTNVNERIVVIEDDDWYSKHWLKSVSRLFDDGYELVGQSFIEYYNVVNKTCKYIANGVTHSALCCTAFTSTAVDTFNEVLAKNDKYFDFKLWQKFNGKRYLISSRNVVGMKGMSGRPNAGLGAKMRGQPTPLGDIIGDEARAYGC